MLFLDLVGLERGQALEAHVEDRLRLLRRELELLDQAGAGAVGVLRCADQLDDRVDVAERDQQAFEDVGAALGALELILGAPGDDLLLVLDVVAHHLAQVQRPRNAVRERAPC